MGTAGFTLIEMLVVMTIIVILAGIGVALYTNGVTKANEAALKTDLSQMREAIDQYYADKGKYPASLDVLVEERYIRNIPPDPFTKSKDTWQTELSEPDAGNPSAEVGVINVKSGSNRTALDNTLYAEW
ncbi:MAG TPA: prepilin-type N-terminal cleavage/methylation domain-containing protein [Vicinamibacterales bacterium]|nr:prepilin-type N-terminal cleavage/methylation domain-containing protein [Vicinamibacterales bacterium]